MGGVASERKGKEGYTRDLGEGGWEEEIEEGKSAEL